MSKKDKSKNKLDNSNDENNGVDKPRPKLSETFLAKKKDAKRKPWRKKDVKNAAEKTPPEQENSQRGGVIELPFFRNLVKIRIEGFNQSRLISMFLREGIRIDSLLRQSPRVMDIVIDTKNKQKGIALIQKMCYTYTVTGESGFTPITKWLLSRMGIFIGILVFTVAAILSNTFIWRIDISGNNKVDSLTIMRELESASIGVGKSKSFDSFEVAKRVNAIDGIVECTIEVVGTTVKVKVIESKDFIPPSNETTPADIVSSFDAEITKITVSAGTGKVGIGDRIPKGGVLISGEVTSSIGEVAYETRARGEVYGRVFFSESAIISTIEEQTQRTGKKYVTTSLGLFGKKTSARSKNKFSVYESVSTESYAFYNDFLPIKVYQTTYYEIEKKIVERPIDELIEDYKSDKLLSLIIKAGGSEIATTIHKEEIAAGLYRVHLYMEAEMLIGEYQERTND